MFYRIFRPSSISRIALFNNNNAYIAGQCKALLQLIYLRTTRSERDDTQQIRMADLSHHVKNSSNPNQYIVEETVETSFIINVDNIYEPKKILSEENTSTGTEYDLNVTSSIKHIFDTPEDPAILDKKENCHDYLSNNVKQNYTAVPPSEECYFPSVQVEANASRVFQEEHTENTINHNCGISAVGSKYNTFIKKPQDSDEIAQIVQDLVLQRFGQAYPHVTKPLMENGKHKVHECGNEEKSLNNNLKSKETNVIEKPKIIQPDLFWHENAAEKQENNDFIKAISESHTVFGNNKEFTYSMTDDESWSESSQGSSLYNLSTYSLDGSIVKRTKCSYTRTPNETYNFDEDSFNDSSFVYSNDLYHIVKENELYEQCPSNNESEDEPQLSKNSMCNLSVETDDISDLVSSNSLLNLTFTRHQKSTESINTIFSNNSQLSYVDVIVREERQNNNTNDYVANLQLQLSEQENIIKQSESVLKFGKGKKGFTGSVPYLEAERILLVSKIRKNALNTAIRKNHPNADSKEDNVLGNITVEHIGCDTNVLKEKIEPDLCYYVCILQNGTNVYSTKISAPDVYGEIDFGGKFVFNNVNSNFNIKLELYSLSIKKKTKLFQCVKIPVPRRHRKFPKFNLVVGREITILNLNEQIFPLKNEVIYADTSVSVSLPETIKGYITIGKEINGHPVCDRRWCVLEGSDLKYYNYPTDEDYEEPIGVISLTNCVDCRPYIRPNTILLEIEKNKGKRVFYVTADNAISFRIWQRKLNLVLGVIKNWRL